MSERTPGPWRSESAFAPSQFLVSSDDATAGDGDGVLVGLVYRADDAAIVAAAPSMLDALRVLTAFAATHTGDGATPEEGRLLDGYGEGVAHAVAAGRAAIARAEGRAP